jgi:5-methylcytosine-specific restriction endonuclease McrA
MVAAREYSRFHSGRPWKAARRLAKIRAGHQCERCKRFLPGKGELHTHHIKPVKRAPALGLEPLNFAVVCPECHNAIEPRSGAVRLSGCNIDGSPTDPRHPWAMKP